MYLTNNFRKEQSLLSFPPLLNQPLNLITFNNFSFEWRIVGDRWENWCYNNSNNIFSLNYNIIMDNIRVVLCYLWWYYHVKLRLEKLCQWSYLHWNVIKLCSVYLNVLNKIVFFVFYFFILFYLSMFFELISFITSIQIGLVFV